MINNHFLRILLLNTLFCISNSLFAQHEVTEAQNELIGTKIEKLTIAGFLKNAPSDTNFHNKFKVLEFWATWCRPCLAAVPHINKLQQKFAGADSLVFISMTDENADKTQKTLERVNFKTIVASDPTRTTHKALRVSYNSTMILPRTVLVDNENTIVWYGTPKELTTALLLKFLNKQPLD